MNVPLKDLKQEGFLLGIETVHVKIISVLSSLHDGEPVNLPINIEVEMLPGCSHLRPEVGRWKAKYRRAIRKLLLAADINLFPFRETNELQ